MKFILSFITIVSLAQATSFKDTYWKLFDAQEYEKSYALLVSESNRTPWAEGRLGELFYSCVPEYHIVCDKAKGIRLIHSAASKEDIRAQSRMAEYYWKRYQEDKADTLSLKQSLERYILAATHPDANFTEISAIATLYYYTPEIKDLTLAFEWYLYGAKKGIKAFYAKVAKMYRNGEGVKRDLIKAKQWSTKQ